MKPLSVMVKVEPNQQSSPSTPSTTNSSTNNNVMNNITHHGVATNNNLMMINPSGSIYPSCLPLAKQSSTSSYIPSQHHKPPQQQQQGTFSLPSIHNFTTQSSSNTGNTSIVEHSIHHYPQTPPQQSWRVEHKHSGSGHDLMEALSAQPPPPVLSVDVVPMDSFIPGYISGYRKTMPQHLTIGSTPEMQPSSSTTGVIITSSPSTTPVKVSHYMAEHELVSSAKAPLVAIASPTTITSQQQQTPPSNNTTQPPVDPSQARMACINCRKSHRKCDKGTPCGECKKRGIPDECVYYEPKKRGPKMKTAEEEAQSKEEAKKRKLNKKNDQSNPPVTTVIDLEPRSNLLQTGAQIAASSSSSSTPTVATTTISTIFSRKEIDRRNYILHMIFPQANFPNDIRENCPDDSFNEMFRLFLSEEFMTFLIECLDGTKSKDVLIPFIREKVLVVILDRIMEPYYQGMYFSLESLFLKYYCLFKLSPHDDNRPILLLESEKSVKQNKKDFNMATNDVQSIICNLWSSFINTILEFKSVNSSYNQLIIKNMLEQIMNKISASEINDNQDVLEIQHALFARYLLLIEIHQQIEGCKTHSVQFKKLVFNFLKLVYLSGVTTKSEKIVDQFEKFNTKFFAILTCQHTSISLNTSYVISEMECFIPRNLTECLTFLGVIAPEGDQDLEYLFLGYMSKLLNLNIYMQGILDTNNINLQEMNASIGKDFFHIAKNLKSPIILSILNSLQNHLITSFFENTISIPESAQLESQFRERILTSVSQFEHQDHFYLRASYSLIRGKDLTDTWKESKKIFIK